MLACEDAATGLALLVSLGLYAVFFVCLLLGGHAYGSPWHLYWNQFGADASVQRYRAATAGENERARAALEKMGAAHLAARPFARCSSGEQVKALIARAMMRDPELLILDETCVHLDLQSREALLAAVDGLAAAAPATTMLFVTQRLEEITPTFAQGLILAGGRIAAQGPRAEILTSENLRLAFPGLSLRLLPGPGGRLWPLPE